MRDLRQSLRQCLHLGESMGVVYGLHLLFLDLSILLVVKWLAELYRISHLKYMSYICSKLIYLHVYENLFRMHWFLLCAISPG